MIDLTGGYEQKCVDVFYKCGFNVHRAEGRRVSAFNKCIGQHAKTDKIDAKILAIYGDKMQEQLNLYSPNLSELAQYLEAIHDFSDTLQQERTRLHAPKIPQEIKMLHRNHAEFLEK